MELETGAGILVRPRRAPQRQIQIVSLRPIDPRTTELLLASGWDNAGFAEVFSRIVLDGHLRESARRQYWTDLERKSRPGSVADEIPF
ncbi:MAG: hypothetical protein HOW73_42750 [Polyangiaceae bacterium]|nr:hypothetical protein [Polyangiaceae bacterium]